MGTTLQPMNPHTPERRTAEGRLLHCSPDIWIFANLIGEKPNLWIVLIDISLTMNEVEQPRLLWKVNHSQAQDHYQQYRQLEITWDTGWRRSFFKLSNTV